MLSITNLKKSFPTRGQVLNGVNLTIEEGEIVALLGPSGCGKSTRSKLIAGLESIDAGEISWADQPLSQIPPHQRGFGLMFQDYALFPHLNVFQNVAFGLNMAKVDVSTIKLRVAEVLALVGLPSFDERDVTTLSGGEQQRVALARALAPRPKLLMLDEPLGALDRVLREQLLDDLRRILREANQSTVFVTHDYTEAFALADQIALMDAGEILQSGPPQAVYLNPANPLAARLIGLPNLFSGEVVQTKHQLELQTALGRFQLPIAAHQAGDELTILFRPDQASLGAGPITLQGQVVEKLFRGTVNQVFVKIRGQQLRFDFPAGLHLPKIGEQIEMSIPAIQVFDWEGDGYVD